MTTYTLWHLNIIASKADRDELNAGGWDSHPRFIRHLDITSGAQNQAEQAANAWHSNEYKGVAWVDCDTIDDVFALTQHIREPGWTLNPEVSPIGFKHRSTSVGDIVEDEDGTLYVCASFGWDKLEGVKGPRGQHSKGAA